MASFLVEHGAKLFDADAFYRTLVASDGPCMREICSLFGSGARCVDGSLNRPYISARVFAPSEDAAHLLAELNRITHHYVRQGYLDWINTIDNPSEALIIIDAPLLYEGMMDAYCDVVVAVIADREKRIQRIVERDGISREKAMARIDAQTPDEELMRKADYVIDNSSDMRSLYEQMNQVITILPNKKGNML